MAADALSGLRILVLEDEFLIAMDIEQICRDHGAVEVVIKRTLLEAESDSGSLAFDVAVVDLMLAGQTTQPFARTLQGQNIPVVFASGYSEVDELRAEFPDAGFVAKPFSETGLVEAILAAVSLRG